MNTLRIFTGVIFDSGNPVRRLAWTARLAAKRLGLATLSRHDDCGPTMDLPGSKKSARADITVLQACIHLQRWKFVNGAAVVLDVWLVAG